MGIFYIKREGKLTLFRMSIKKEKDKPMLKRSVINDKTPNLLSQADNEIKTLVSLKIRVIAG